MWPYNSSSHWTILYKPYGNLGWCDLWTIKPKFIRLRRCMCIFWLLQISIFIRENYLKIRVKISLKVEVDICFLPQLQGKRRRLPVEQRRDRLYSLPSVCICLEGLATPDMVGFDTFKLISYLNKKVAIPIPFIPVPRDLLKDALKSPGKHRESVARLPQISQRLVRAQQEERRTYPEGGGTCLQLMVHYLSVLLLIDKVKSSSETVALRRSKSSGGKLQPLNQ